MFNKRLFILDRYTWRAIDVELIQRGKSRLQTSTQTTRKNNWVLSGEKPKMYICQIYVLMILNLYYA